MKLPVNYNELNQRQRKLVREEYVELQKGNCHHCGQSLDGMAAMSVLKQKVNKNLFPTGFFRWPVHLHHDHDTGLTIGAVHSYCNAVLWQYYGE